MAAFKYTVKLTCLVTCLSFICSTLQAQTTDYDGDNYLKLNVPALLLKNISLQYERPVGQKTSVALGIRYAPTSSLPFKQAFKNIIDDDEVSKQIDGFRTGNFVVEPEFRYYTGEQAGRGFYIAPYVRYAHYTAELPFKYDYNGTEKVFPFSGSLNAFSGGVMIGSQFKISQLVYLDWWIIGGSYGHSSGRVDGRAPLDENEQQALRDELEEFKNGFIKTDYKVDQNGATIDLDGKWITARLGLALGIRF
ncbi:DUF3575 domain-containing protein [Mucilaginibacter sp. UR6-1]|uniref:DUF3575 domain-containing protein n=1 Tax=Mucilaginibacter sp. UR6-1 TaxID=1435643 RepID=UPI001E580386|nr:DUF3575 domain-containing protein [Mucilaginibacter sp. UR6-1]MCC8407423.1 DUF3575 domain-containing protein [Mucilaginibacter sp. UR6-1]